MEPQHVRAFLAVARHESFSRAAKELRRGQPAVTMAIKALEEELHVRVFERVARGAKLTAAGKALQETAGPLLDQWDTLPKRLEETLSGEMRGPVRVGAGEGAVLYLLPSCLRVFRERHRQVELVVRNQPVEETLRMLRAGELDFGLRSLSSQPPGLIYRPSPTLTFDRVAIAPKAHPIHRVKTLSLAELARHPFVMPWERSTTRRLVERKLEEEGLRCQVALEAGGWEIIKRYVALGLGIAIVPAFCIEPQDRRHLAARPVSHLFGQDAYGIVVRRRKYLSRAAKELIRIIDPKFPVETLQGE